MTAELTGCYFHNPRHNNGQLRMDGMGSRRMKASISRKITK